MKRIFLLLFAFQSYSFLFSQSIDFAPVGAKWWVNQITNDSFGIPLDSFIIAEVIGEEMKEGHFCRVISNLTGYGLPSTAHVFTQNDSVFFYSEVTHQFELLYDFTATVGSQWVIRGLSEIENEFNITVTNVQIEEIDGQELRVWYIDFDRSSEFWDNRIIEQIGNTHFLAPTYRIGEPSSSGILPAAGVRCYEDSSIYVNFLFGADCEFGKDISNVRHDELSAYISIFPNPAQDFLYLELPRELRNHPWTFTIFDLFGSPLLQSVLSDNLTEIDISSLAPGVYIICFKDSRSGTKLHSEKLLVID